MEDTNTATYLQGGAGYCMYLSSAGSQTNVGRRNILIEGGDICTIGSGVDSNNNAPSNNDTPSTTTNYNRLAFNVRIKGGTIHGNVYGGAAKSPSGGNRVMVMTGGQVKGWFAAGCNGTDSDGGQNYGTSWVYIGGKAKVDSEGSTKVLGYANGGNVYAAGAGRQGAETCGEMTFGSNLVIADESYIERGAYGGGNYGYAKTNSSTNIYITGGTNDGKDGTVNSITTKGGVYGGANQQDGPDINLYMTGGEMRGGVYGGCNTQGTISSNVTMKINGGQVGTASSTANIHGGGYGNLTTVSGDVDMTIGASTSAIEWVKVYGNVYGGSALGAVSGDATITMNKGVINGNLFGGALGDNDNAALVNGNVAITVHGGKVTGAVFGCNDANGTPKGTVTVTVDGTDPTDIIGGIKNYALQGVYGGGNLAHYDPTTSTNGYPKVVISNCNTSIKDVYGGGNAAAVPYTSVTVNGGDIGRVFAGGNGESGTPAHVGYKNTERSPSGTGYGTGTANAVIKGGTIGQLFGGSNANGVIRAGGNINIDKNSTCLMKIGEVYRGGNEAPGALASLTLGCTGTLTTAHATANNTDNRIGYELEGIGDLYGGSRKADNTGAVTLNITGGIINRVFGGNNLGGNVAGDIQININQGSNGCDWFVGDVFSGGNQAAYTKTPDVNIQNGIVSRCVYGGGNEAGVAGGDVTMSGGTVLGGIYGGCNTSGTVTGDIAVNVTGGTVGSSSAKANVHGGGYGFNTKTDGNVDVNIGTGSTGTAVIYGDVYGGSALGDVNSGTEDYTHVMLNAGTIYGDAYGGGLGSTSEAAWVFGNVKVTQNGVGFVRDTATDDEGNTVVTAGRIFGCNNLNGSPKGTVLVEVVKTTPTSGSGHVKGTYEMAAVYGGGNLAPYDPTNATATGQYATSHTATNKPVQVVVNGCQDVSIEYVYGGGNAAPTPATDVLILGAYEIGNVFGGGNGKDKYTLDGSTWNNNNGADGPSQLREWPSQLREWATQLREWPSQFREWPT